MRLEYALSIGEPRSAMIQAIQSRSTGPSHLTQADVLGALGLVQKYEGVGLALMMARYTKDKESHCKAVIGVMAECSKLAPKYVGSIKTRGQGMALKALAVVAVQHYCRTADTPGLPVSVRGGVTCATWRRPGCTVSPSTNLAPAVAAPACVPFQAHRYDEPSSHCWDH